MSELVSVIVPVYNIEDYLPRCLACIKAQTYTNLEIILVDDGSTDGSGRLCDEYAASDPRVRVIHHPENRGLWAARNTGQDAATGEYLWFPDGDDYFHRDIIKIMYEAINKVRSDGEMYDLAIVGRKKTNHFDEDVDFEVDIHVYELTVDNLFDDIVWRDSRVWGASSMWNKFYRRRLIMKTRSNEYKYSQDCDFNMRVFLREPKIVFIDNTLYYYFRRSSAAMCQQDYNYIRSEYKILYSFNILNSLQGSKLQYSHYFLDCIYNWMPIWLEFANRTRNETTFWKECRWLFVQTRYQYMLYSERPLHKRLKRIIKIGVSLSRIKSVF